MYTREASFGSFAPSLRNDRAHVKEQVAEQNGQHNSCLTNNNYMLTNDVLKDI